MAAADTLYTPDPALGKERRPRCPGDGRRETIDAVMTSRMAAVLRTAALLSFGLALAVAGLACGTRPSPGGTASPSVSAGQAEVPGAFEDLYAELDKGLSRYAGAVAEGGAGTVTAFGAELLAANGNQGPALLRPEAMASVRSNLDQLQRLGVRGVSVQISDPLLMSDFPGSAEYLQFYRRVADEVRRRGLLLLVETGPVFSGTLYSSVEVGGRWPDTKRYFEDRGQQVANLFARLTQLIDAGPSPPEGPQVAFLVHESEGISLPVDRVPVPGFLAPVQRGSTRGTRLAGIGGIDGCDPRQSGRG